MLGILDENGLPLQQMGILQTPAGSTAPKPTAGKLCGECGNTDDDPQGWLRLLHRLRGGGELRVKHALG
jgi:hypothetical protein